MNPLHVVIVTTSFPVSANPHSGIFVWRYVNSLPPNVRVTIVTAASNQRDSGNILDSRHTIHYFRYGPRRLQLLCHQPGGLPAALKHRPWLIFLVPGFISSMLLACYSASRRSDLVHANWSLSGTIAGVVCKVTGKPLVTTLRGSDVNLSQSSVIARWILRLCIRLTNQIVTVNHDLKEQIVDRYPTLLKPVAVIENGVDQDFYDKGKHRTYLSNNKPRVLAIGNLTKDKGIDVLLRAALKLKGQCSIEVSIVGSGAEYRDLRNLTTELELNNVRFLDSVPPNDVADLMSEHDLFVLPSYHEGRSNVLLEAMASGMPIAATDIRGTREMITDGKTGLLFERGNHKELANVIKCLIDDKELAASVGRSAHNWVHKNEYLWSNTAEKYGQLFEKLLNYQSSTKD